MVKLRDMVRPERPLYRSAMRTTARRAVGHLLALASCAGCLGLHGCASGPSPQPTRIPFRLTQADNISVRARVNGTEPVNLLLHTAMDSVSLTRVATARMARFEATESATVRSWGGTTTARHSTGNTLQIGDLVYRDVAITEDEQTGPGTDGKFGPNLFAGKIVEVDYDAEQIVLHAALPKLDERWHAVPLTVRDGLPCIDCEIVVGDRTLTQSFLLHSGFHGTALLDTEFVAANALDGALATIRESVLHDSYGNEVKTRVVQVPALRLGPITMRDVPVGVFEGKVGSRRTSLLGANALKRCNFVLDTANGRLWVRPSRFVDAPFAK